MLTAWVSHRVCRETVQCRMADEKSGLVSGIKRKKACFKLRQVIQIYLNTAKTKVNPKTDVIFPPPWRDWWLNYFRSFSVKIIPRWRITRLVRRNKIQTWNGNNCQSEQICERWRDCIVFVWWSIQQPRLCMLFHLQQASVCPRKLSYSSKALLRRESAIPWKHTWVLIVRCTCL